MLAYCLSLVLGTGLVGGASLRGQISSVPSFSWLWEGEYLIFGLGFEHSNCPLTYTPAHVLLSTLAVSGDTSPVTAGIVPATTSIELSSFSTTWSYSAISVELIAPDSPSYESGFLTPALGRLYFEPVSYDLDIYDPQMFHTFFAENRGSLLWSESELWGAVTGASTDAVTIDSSCYSDSIEFMRIGLPVAPIPTENLVAGNWQGVSVSARMTPESEIYNLAMTQFEASFNDDDMSGTRSVIVATGAAELDSGTFDWSLDADRTAIETGSGLGPTFHTGLSYGFMLGLRVSLTDPSALTLSRDGFNDYEFEFYAMVREHDEVPLSGIMGSYGWTILTAYESSVHDVPYHFSQVERGVLTLLDNGRFRMYSNPPYSSIEVGDEVSVEWGQWKQVDDEVVLEFAGANAGEVFHLMVGDGGNVMLGLEVFESESDFDEADLIVAIRMTQSELSGPWEFFPDIEPQTPWGHEFYDYDYDGYQIPSPIFGDFSSLSDFPWIYHRNHGGLYCHGEGGMSYWFYDYTMGSWLYTTLNLYPVMYSSAHGAWLYYYEGTGEYGYGRWFYNFATKEWMPPEDVSVEATSQ